MIKKTLHILIFLLLSSHSKSSAQKALLPMPQKVIYGNGEIFFQQVRLKCIKIDKIYEEYLNQELSKRFNIESIQNKSGEDLIIIKLEQTDTLSALPDLDEKVGPHSREAYSLIIDRQSVKIKSRSSAGILYGIQTLFQLFETIDNIGKLPIVEIEDWPMLAYRGFMVDMSHCQLPKIDEIKHQLDFLSKWKINQYYFYSEGSIELNGYPLLMDNAKYSQKDVIEIINYARLRCIDVIPVVELYGHMHDLFKLQKYAHLAAIPHGGEFKPNAPERKLIITDWVKQLTKIFPSPFFHLGFDETWLLSQTSRKLNIKPELIYLAMLNETVEIIKQEGKKTMLWADMLQKYPSIIAKIPKDVIAIPWHYFALPDNKYKPLFEPFKNNDVAVMLQGASINWNWVVPLYGTSFENVDKLVEEGRKYNCVGLISSGWTDDTQTLLRLTFPDMAYSAAVAWQKAPLDRVNFFKNYAATQYPVTQAGLFENALKNLEQSAYLIQNSIGNSSEVFWHNPFEPDRMKVSVANLPKLSKARLLAQQAQMALGEMLASVTDSTTIFAMIVGVKMLDYISLKYIYSVEINQLWNEFYTKKKFTEWESKIYFEVVYKYHTRIADLIDDISELKLNFKQAWLNEYTAFRLEIALAKYDIELHFWLRLQSRMAKHLKSLTNKSKYLANLVSLTKQY